MAGKAIVMGGSIAGLWTARVLADHFDEVVIVERDQLPNDPVPRAGVPQARQYHILLLRGLTLLDELFPSLRDDLISAGAIELDVTEDVQSRSRGRWLERFRSGQTLLSCSRLLLEATMRAHLRRNPVIRWMEGTEVIGLHSDDDGQTVAGPIVKKKESNQEERILADLIVDTLGRRSPTPDWLAQLGYQRPEVSNVNSFLGYVTRRYQIPDGWQADWKMLLLFGSAPDEPRGGLIFPEENNVWVVMMAGANKDYPPTDDEGFREYARSLGPEFFEAVEAAEPISKAYGYRGTDSNWHHYEKMEHWPERFVVLGDALCAFNPIYGQGMTVSALSAVALGEEIARSNGNLDGLAKRAQRAVAAETADAWLLATGADVGWPETVGAESDSGLASRFGRWYIDHLLAASGNDRTLRLAFLDVNQLIKPAGSLFAPGLMLRVLRQRILN